MVMRDVEPSTAHTLLDSAVRSGNYATFDTVLACLERHLAPEQVCDNLLLRFGFFVSSKEQGIIWF